MTATSTLYPTTVAGTAGSTWTTTGNATGSGVGTTAAAWAVFTNATNGGSGATGTISLSGYAAQAPVASGSTIDSVVLSLRGNVATVARWTAASCTAQLFSGTTAIGSPVAVGTLSTSTSNVWTITFSGANAPTYAQLADLRVTVTAVHTSTTSSTFNVDAAGLVVNYTPVTAVTLPYSQTWTGTDGASWPGEWVNQGGTATIQGNAGQLTTPVGGYTGAREYLAGMPATADQELLVDITMASAAVEQYVSIALRGDGNTNGADAGRPAFGYAVVLYFDAVNTSSTWHLERYSGTTYDNIAAGPMTLTGGVAYRCRFRVVGATTALRLWPAAGVEPAAWTYTADDTIPYLTAGKARLAIGNGNDGVARTGTYDNLSVSVAGADEVHTTTGTATATASASAATATTRTKTGAATATATATRSGSSTRVKTGTATAIATASATTSSSTGAVTSGTALATATASGTTTTTRTRTATATATATATRVGTTTRTTARTALATATATATSSSSRTTARTATATAGASSSTSTVRAKTGTATLLAGADALTTTWRTSTGIATAYATASGVTGRGSAYRDITLTVGPGRSRSLTASGRSRGLTAVGTGSRSLTAEGTSRGLAAVGRSRTLTARPRE